MHDAADVLLKWLPIYQHPGFGLQCPDDVTFVLEALPRICRPSALVGQNELIA
jgi:hypothetical protein